MNVLVSTMVDEASYGKGGNTSFVVHLQIGMGSKSKCEGRMRRLRLKVGDVLAAGFKSPSLPLLSLFSTGSNHDVSQIEHLGKVISKAALAVSDNIVGRAEVADDGVGDAADENEFAGNCKSPALCPPIRVSPAFAWYGLAIEASDDLLSVQPSPSWHTLTTTSPLDDVSV